jgi:hypothetical protein
MLLPLLERAKDQNGGRLPPQLLNAGIADYCFWPWLEEEACDGCEPDVLIRLDGTAGKGLVLIEAKYRSGKSSVQDEGERPNDQLAREWVNAQTLAQREGRIPSLVHRRRDALKHPAV